MQFEYVVIEGDDTFQWTVNGRLDSGPLWNILNTHGKLGWRVTGVSRVADHIRLILQRSIDPED